MQYKVLSGDTIDWTRKGDSGKNVTNVYCGTCKGLLRVEAEFMADMMIFKTGTLDDQSLLDKLPVLQEVYTKHRPVCIGAVQDADQKQVT